MAITWLLALKVIPWTDVIEHAPKLLDRQHASAPEPEVSEPAPVGPNALTQMDEMRQALSAARMQIERQAQTQHELTQTVTQLAEQNARLVSAVEVLRLRSRLLLAAVLVLLVWLGGLTWMV